MTDRAKHLGPHVPAFVVMCALLAGCASTPKQDYVWAMWGECKATGQMGTSTLEVARVEPDGRYWTNTTTGPFELH
jgi:hypothetical protein